ncbi:MAG: flagellar biosynthesis protein FlhA [Candidatus Cloacimonadota bacterium]|nr:MAG: flagellar biosynthesis protein FlhA [Candidatus Cloacimonadota bacterium]PIE78397.1 MAG: flagellar biosynthesis protein FlhA [Candidatus Delongbacteria bacterium]
MESFLENIGKRSDVAFAFGVISIVAMLVIPIPTFLIDLLLAINFSISLIVILVSMYNKSPADFSVFPGLLLVITLFRLALNVSTTRMIIGNKGDAGKMVQAFGEFVAGGNIIVGLIMFLILMIINIKVITNGSTRIAEVAARFTLDAMPGKQMAVDADLQNGIITEEEATRRRERVRGEADFYGAMDGASKFVKGDATAGMIITGINIVGGISMGIFYDGLEWTKALPIYTISTIGDGLVSSIPALIISTSAGIIVSRAASKNDMGSEMIGQLIWSWKALAIASTVTFFFALVPGLPFIPFTFISIILASVSYFVRKKDINKVVIEKKNEEEKAKQAGIEESNKPEKVEDFLKVDPLELEIGYDLISIADSSAGGDLIDRITMIRKQYASELGIIIPPIRIRDNIQLGPNEYLIKIRGITEGSGSIYTNKYMALNPMNIDDQNIVGEATVEPTYGLPAKWIDVTYKEEAEIIGLTIIEPASVLSTHIMEIVKKNAHRLLSREETSHLIENLKKEHKTVVEELIPSVISLGVVQKVLQSLLKEGIPVRDLSLILESLSDYTQYTKDFETLTELVRQTLAATITKKFQDDDDKITCMTLDPQVEQMINEGVKNASAKGETFNLPPNLITSFIEDINQKMEMMTMSGNMPILICSPSIRKFLKKLTDPYLPDLVILSFSELTTNIQINSIYSVGG